MNQWGAHNTSQRGQPKRRIVYVSQPPTLLADEGAPDFPPNNPRPPLPLVPHQLGRFLDIAATAVITALVQAILRGDISREALIYSVVTAVACIILLVLPRHYQL